MMSVVCGVCNTTCGIDASDVKCGGMCKKLFHGDCVKKDAEGRKLRSGSKDWMCKECKSQSGGDSVKSSSSGTASALTKDFLVKVMDNFKSDMFNELKSVKKEVTDLKESVEFLSSSHDAFNTTMKSIQEELMNLKSENTEIKAQNAELKQVTCDLRERLRALEQYTRRTNIEISGVPETPGENVEHVIRDVGTALGVEVEESQVSAAHRIPSYRRDRPASLVVQFKDRPTRDMWITKFKAKKTLTAKNINPTFKDQKVYINEHLSPDNKQFLTKLKQKATAIGFKYVWCREGKFYVRKADGERCRRVNTYDELDKLK